MAKQSPNFDFNELTKMLGDYQIPGVDWQAIMASQQKNLAALTEANQLLMQGAQTVMQRQVEIMQRAMTELAQASQELMQEGDPQAGAKKRYELAQASFEAAIRNMRELAELAGKSNQEALEVINKRALESFEEIKSTVETQRKQAPSAKK